MLAMKSVAIFVKTSRLRELLVNRPIGLANKAVVRRTTSRGHGFGLLLSVHCEVYPQTFTPYRYLRLKDIKTTLWGK